MTMLHLRNSDNSTTTPITTTTIKSKEVREIRWKKNEP